MTAEDKIKAIPSPERDAMMADLEALRRVLPALAEAMMIFYDALLKEGFEHEVAQDFVARKFLD